MEKQALQVVGILRETGFGGEVEVISGPLKKRVAIPAGRLNGAPYGMVVQARLEEPLDPEAPTGSIVEVLGEADRPDLAMEAIYRAYNWPEHFPDEVLAAARRLPRSLRPATIAREIAEGRRDLRRLPTLTIDGKEAKDLDDAISIERAPKGGYRLFVHIADVSHYVRENSLLDKEARARGTSVYPVDRVLPMLPTRLSNGICSLNPHVDRLTLTVCMTFSAEGERLDGEVFPSVICSNLRGNYEDVYASLEAGHPRPGYEEMFDDLVLMRELAKLLTAKRASRGSFGFDFPETVVEMDEEGQPTAVRPATQTYANELIEEFMIAANCCVAERFRQLNAPFLYRVHEDPDPEKMERLVRLIRRLGVRTGPQIANNPKALAALLRRLEWMPEGLALSHLLLRSMAKARYSHEPLGHYGLALRDYCHFTSPIRRYPDLFIHRVIKAYLKGKPKISSWRKKVPELAEHCSEQERTATAIERETTELKVATYLAGHIGETFEGKISGMTPGGFFVELENTAEGMVPFRSLPDYFRFEEDSLQAVGERSGLRLKLGMPVTIRVAAVDVLRRRVDFDWLWGEDSPLAKKGKKPQRLSQREKNKKHAILDPLRAKKRKSRQDRHDKNEKKRKKRRH